MHEKPAALVLGGGGFIGVNLCRRLLATGHCVRAFGRPSQFPGDLAGVEMRYGEFRDRRAVAAALASCDVVFHLIHGAMPQQAELDPIGDLENNVAPTIALLQACREAGVRRVVFVSSGGTVYGRAAMLPTPETAPTEPICAYGVAKLAIENYLRLFEHHYDLEFRALRVANPFGPFQTAGKGQGIIAALILNALKGEPVEIWGDGSVVRDFVYVEDVAEALIAAATDKGGRRIYNIGAGEGRSLREVIAAIEGCLGAPLDLVWRAARPLDVPISTLDISRAAEDLDWRPRTPFPTGLERTLAWARARLSS